jgi:hypothetical protein
VALTRTTLGLAGRPESAGHDTPVGLPVLTLLDFTLLAWMLWPWFSGMFRSEQHDTGWGGFPR